MDFIANAPYGMTYKEFYNIYNGKIIHKEPLCLIEIISHDNVIETENNIYNISNIDESQSNLQLSKKSVSQSNVLSKVYFYEKNINPEINDHLILSSNNNQVLPIQNVYELPAINNYSKNVEFYNNQSNEHLNIILEGEKENSNNFNDDQSNKNDDIIFEVMDPSEEDICISDIINTHLNEQKEFSIYYEDNKKLHF
ncbi:hypothetical protein NAPIS_ORF00365 [Vairimorpha apis BRL 01]|uniref:Uncharacterized protein n=1 Tax=Vairimorpha apis BRL 01 TaxID=1037528 RepID=T0MM23_9MICR|nr:hypothetical protein NAPIS_ORF00365 [Vairimorpha apis BRL 01]